MYPALWNRGREGKTAAKLRRLSTQQKTHVDRILTEEETTMKVETIVRGIGVCVASVFICANLGMAQQGKVYKNKTFGYQLTYPADFTMKTMGSATVFSSTVQDKTFAFSPSVNVVVIDLGTSPADLDQFYRQSKDAVERSLGKVKFIEDKKEKLAGANACRLVYTSRQIKADFKFMQVLCVHDNRAYLLTYTALQEQYDKFLKIAQSIIQSFQFTAK
jgi:hypothetical protein